MDVATPGYSEMVGFRPMLQMSILRVLLGKTVI